MPTPPSAPPSISIAWVCYPTWSQAPTGRVPRSIRSHRTFPDRSSTAQAYAPQAGDFGPRHQSYYKLGYTNIPGGFNVAGETGYDFGMDWMSTVVEGVTR